MEYLWRIYYDDNSTFDNQDGDWQDAPYRGALVLVSLDQRVGRELDHGNRGEFFAWWPGASKPWGFDRVGILDYLVEKGFPEETLLSNLSMQDWKGAGVKLGRSVDNDVFSNILNRASKDSDFPPKSASSPREVE